MGITVIRKPVPQDLWNLHVHSKYSATDALPEPADLVARAKAMRQPALGMTDHGNSAATVKFYKAAMAAGIKPFPGSELYVVRDRAAHAAAVKKRIADRDPIDAQNAKRYHMCVAAFTSEGYVNLVNLQTMTHANFHGKPIIDFRDIAALGEAGFLKGIAGTSGCYFGLPVTLLTQGDTVGTKTILTTMARAFDRFYVELQNHNIVHDDGYWTDDLVADAMHLVAQDLGLPCILTQDSHYTIPGDRHDHESLKRLVAFGPDPDEAVFPGDGFHLADAEWFLSHHEGDRLRAGREGLADLLEAHDLSIPALDNYAYNIPITVADPDADLALRCHEALDAMHDSKRRLVGQRHYDRLLDELEIIKDTGMAGYILLVGECTDWLRENHVFYQARGSASGSIVCWLMGITQLDPLRWGLSFERFISRDRTKPPDIDLDIEHDRRAEFITWLSGRFSVHQIGTWTKFSLKGDYDEGGEPTGAGSLLRRYFTRLNATGAEKMEWNDIPDEDKADMYRLSDRKLLSHYGVHPAGLVLTSSEAELRDLVPLMQVASSSTMVTQYDMKDVEALGLVKLDVLGLKTLTVLHRALDNLGRDYADGFDWIPLTDSPTYTMIGKGVTDGVFQLEGYAARRGCGDLKPTKIGDVIAAMALFRPATMNSGMTESYISRKKGRESLPKRHDIIMRHTKDTYGIPLYQEQIISILRDLGMSPDDLTLFLKAVKSSNDNVEWARGIIEHFKPQLQDEANRLGFSTPDWAWLWNAIEGFGEYGFNAAHATAYGLTAYRCAYLLKHHPVEFYAALLSVAAGQSKAKNEKQSKEQRYASAARRDGIRLLRPDVNYSGVTYSVDPRGRGIRRGLVAIKGIGETNARAIVEARADGPFTSLEDFAQRVDHRKVNGIKPFLLEGDKTVGKFGILVDTGAFDSIEEM